nr:ftsL_broad: cell division protein [uncultured bacterium]
MKVVLLLALVALLLVILGLIYAYTEIRDNQRRRKRLAARQPVERKVISPYTETDRQYLLANGVTQETLDEIAIQVGRYRV